ncbi:methyltransferase of ATP-grasp peptide maturase system [Nocardiopsis mwathae]|uniref:Protein-L-isoaspartate O-methyltransferase n=1 Tax=Nocardiopsis mwathae TaxID=1472723 RepID=A0A7W9YHU4_9ACTN|nr:ATP-grasp peptide maturase system methyltransferase [Nocardiopsis mwathae]MBB6172408.1 methyltransferase of ATP-grasp peptide maturase system [Nocardiopsis mwathae]
MTHRRPCTSTLADQLVQAGEVEAGTPLAEAFAKVDRGAFVPAFALPDHTGPGVRYRLIDGRKADQHAEWASHIYADETLIIEIKGRSVTDALPEGTGTGRWTSSSTMPSLMARHLRELELAAGPRVLEIGAGSGYNTAILCELLGDERVTSIDISPHLVASATRSLASHGYRPVVAEHDGHQGYPGGAPYDRITSTTAFTHVPPAWVDQVSPGGIILVNIAGGTGGAVLRLDVAEGSAEGRFLPQWAGFMPARTHEPTERVTVDDEGEQSWTRINPNIIRDSPSAAFVAQLATTHAASVNTQADDGTPLLFMEGADGAWAEVETIPDGGRYRVDQGGPRWLWDLVEQEHQWWHAQGRPPWSAFGATVTCDGQWVWFGSPTGTRRWPLPAPDTSTNNVERRKRS